MGTIKHHDSGEINFHVVFQAPEEMTPFKLIYTVGARNMPTPISGELSIIPEIIEVT